MEKKLYDEMVKSIKEIDTEMNLASKKIFLFGHCNATLELIDLLESKGFKTTAILDNSDVKQGLEYKGARVIYPKQILEMAGEDPVSGSMVLITSRFYAAMQKQLREIGYDGPVRKVIDYNTFAEYSLSEDTIRRMTEREKHGEELLGELRDKYPGFFRVFCPFNALGDVYLMISYWESFAKMRRIGQAVFSVPSGVLGKVIRLFGDHPVEVYEQKELDAMIQAVIYTRDESSFIAHQDRPYVVNLHRAQYVKCISLEQMYCCGVYGLPLETEPTVPTEWRDWDGLDSINKGHAVVLSPFAKSVTALPSELWVNIVEDYRSRGYQVFTNVVGDEVALPGTEPLRAELCEMKSVLEAAGIFIGIRSGLCDVVRTAKCKKIALYPDYNYCDTKWKAIDIYSIDGFENVVVRDGDLWEELKKQIV